MQYDELLREVSAEQSIPAIALGISRGGDLESHAIGQIGNSHDAVFRIASMTKSFTAAAVLMLRDAGRLSLDDPVKRHTTFDDSTTTIRDLLTMNAGFPTDDPWGDRHESTPIEEFDALVAQGVRRIRAARGGFEYSNLGYALLGRVITAVSASDYTRFIEHELLAPLGMNATVFDHRRIPVANKVQGYARRASGLHPEPEVLPGAFSPMGGLHSSVRDLVTWMHGFVDPDSPHPLLAASRREQQQPHALARLVTRADGTASAVSYGYGLMAEEHSTLGRFIQHSGGYPGFGSHMRWHPVTGIAVVALANRTYAPMGALVDRVIYDLVDGAQLPSGELWPETMVAMEVAESLLQLWDDDLADRHFALNMDRDEPRAERRAHAQALMAEASVRLPGSIHARTPASVRWRVTGAAGDVTIVLLMSPDPDPRIQFLQYTQEAI